LNKPKSFLATLIAAALFSVSAILMSALADPGSSGGGDPPFSLDQIAAGDKKAIGRFFAANQIKYDLDNFMQVAFHGLADFEGNPPPPEMFASFAWLASCIDSHSGHLFVIDREGRMVFSEKTGCPRSVKARDINGDGKPELLSTSSSGGTGVGSTLVSYHFYGDGNFYKGLEYEKSSYEAVEGSFIFPGATDWRQDVWALKETKGEVKFLDVNQDGFKELAKVSYTSRYAVQNYDKGRDLNGSVFARVDEAVKDVFGKRLGVETSHSVIWKWDLVSHTYLKR
jgi:hypothetical protein